MNSGWYESFDVGKHWSKVANIVNKQSNAYVSITDGSVDWSGQHHYVSCDGAFAASHNNGQSYTTYWSVLSTSVETDPTGQYVIILTDKSLSYSADYASTWTVLKDFTVSGSPVVTPTFLKITSDHKYVYLLEKSSSTSTTTTLVHFTVSSKSSKTVFSTSYTVNDVAISDTGNSMIISSMILVIIVIQVRCRHRTCSILRRTQDPIGQPIVLVFKSYYEQERKNSFNRNIISFRTELS